MPTASSKPLGKSGFDLSERRVMSLPVGLLTPTYCLDVVPGDKINLSLQSFIRTQPLNTAAFTRARIYHQAHFVPYRLLWSRFDQFVTSVKNNPSALFGKKNGSQLYFGGAPQQTPFFSFSTLWSALYNLKVNGSKNKYNIGTNTEPVYPMLDIHGIPIYRTAYRLLENLGYPYIDDSWIRNKKSGGSGLDTPTNENPDFMMNPFRLLAYQRIYNDFYRDDMRVEQDTLSFNCDDCLGGVMDSINTTHGVYTSQQRLEKMLTPRYKLFKKDMFTQLQPSVVYTGNDIKEALFSSLGSASSVKGQKNVADPATSSVTISNSGVKVNVVGNAFSLVGLRASYAIEKYLMNTQNAPGLDYSEQILAHYGFEVPSGRYFSSHYIGEVVQNLSIGEVVQTADSVGESNKILSKVGEIAGRGTSSADNHMFDFVVPEHGIIMVISYCEPLQDYPSAMSPFVEKLSPLDYFQPEFSNLGMGIMYQRNLSPLLVQPTVVSGAVKSCRLIKSSVLNAPLGYSPRYAEYKSAVDKVFGEFRPGNSLSAWVSPRRFFGLKIVNGQMSVPGGQVGENPDPSRPGDSGVVGTEILTVGDTDHMLTVDPASLDSITGINYDGFVKTDPLLSNLFFSVKAVRPMSTTGVPV